MSDPASRKDVGEMRLRELAFDIDGELTMCRKSYVKDMIVKLKREKKLPWRGYKPNLAGIVHVYEKVTREKRRKYDGQLYLEWPEELDRILEDIIVADYEKRDYQLQYDWELLDYLKRRR